MGLGLCCLDPCPFVRVASCAKDRKQQSGKSTIADKDKITPDLPRVINTTNKADNKMIWKNTIEGKVLKIFMLYLCIFLKNIVIYNYIIMWIHCINIYYYIGIWKHIWICTYNIYIYIYIQKIMTGNTLYLKVPNRPLRHRFISKFTTQPKVAALEHLLAKSAGTAGSPCISEWNTSPRTWALFCCPPSKPSSMVVLNCCRHPWGFSYSCGPCGTGIDVISFGKIPSVVYSLRKHALGKPFNSWSRINRSMRPWGCNH